MAVFGSKSLCLFLFWLQFLTSVFCFQDDCRHFSPLNSLVKIITSNPDSFTVNFFQFKSACFMLKFKSSNKLLIARNYTETFTRQINIRSPSTSEIIFEELSYPDHGSVFNTFFQFQFFRNNLVLAIPSAKLPAKIFQEWKSFIKSYCSSNSWLLGIFDLSTTKVTFSCHRHTKDTFQHATSTLAKHKDITSLNKALSWNAHQKQIGYEFPKDAFGSKSPSYLPVILLSKAHNFSLIRAPWKYFSETSPYMYQVQQIGTDKSAIYTGNLSADLRFQRITLLRVFGIENLYVVYCRNNTLKYNGVIDLWTVSVFTVGSWMLLTSMILAAIIFNNNYAHKSFQEVQYIGLLFGQYMIPSKNILCIMLAFIGNFICNLHGNSITSLVSVLEVETPFNTVKEFLFAGHKIYHLNATGHFDFLKRYKIFFANRNMTQLLQNTFESVSLEEYKVGLVRERRALFMIGKRAMLSMISVENVLKLDHKAPHPRCYNIPEIIELQYIYGLFQTFNRHWLWLSMQRLVESGILGESETMAQYAFLIKSKVQNVKRDYTPTLGMDVIDFPKFLPCIVLTTIFIAIATLMFLKLEQHRSLLVQARMFRSGFTIFVTRIKLIVQKYKRKPRNQIIIVASLENP